MQELVFQPQTPHHSNERHTDPQAFDERTYVGTSRALYKASDPFLIPVQDPNPPT